MIKPGNLDLRGLGFFRHRKVGERYLLTNEAGEHILLGEDEFTAFVEGRIRKESYLYSSLRQKHFFADNTTQKELTRRYACKYKYVQAGTSLHIVIPTLRCNQRCIYCHAKAQTCSREGYDMDEQTARLVVDRIFESPSARIALEFQGGEPLLNWDILVFITRYALRKNKTHRKNLRLILVSNLTLMDEERYGFLTKHGFSICSSLDGPRFIHDRHRPMLNGRSAYDEATPWIKRFFKDSPGFGSSALITLTRFSLGFPKEIIHEYLRWGMLNIPLRPVSVLGYAGERRKTFGITAEEYLKFYYRALDYILELNRITGERVSERMAGVCLQKIFGASDPGYMDLRSPCGAGCGQLAYFYDGSVYTCDEARMLGDDSFKLGNVHTHSYRDLMQSANMKAATLSSCLDGLYCDYCAYKPYCGMCPVVNWKEYGSLFAQPNVSFTCKVNKGMFDYIFRALQDREKERILKSWIGL
ncbi:MAG: His-Xaa-Ser system radical SAM maturase HxsB [Candidatus Omnitrophica bacterium]|nr:His-Xaa-Ser system radical SAM maturase HxsB [Candidatus Omnitrophota bacterium]